MGRKQKKLDKKKEKELLTRRNAHHQLFEAYKIAYPNRSFQRAQHESQQEWAMILAEFTTDDKALLNHVRSRLASLIGQESQQVTKFKNHFVNSKANHTGIAEESNLVESNDTERLELNDGAGDPSHSVPLPQPPTLLDGHSADQNEQSVAPTVASSNILKRSYPTPAQDDCGMKIQP
ncbi:hypothetical protein QAD02_021831 [Eretmocerus hayati]|uniref:Uncharacterized protein n=1 Tax=Eretmocerus hayati TaxID=131215 RepID=A0ACC2PSR8_9HYME|nr:hypothetical protein QAD02_021831 [Eretmocerus hayati]